MPTPFSTHQVQKGMGPSSAPETLRRGLTADKRQSAPTTVATLTAVLGTVIPGHLRSPHRCFLPVFSEWEYDASSCLIIC